MAARTGSAPPRPAVRRWRAVPWGLRVLAMVQMLIGFAVGLFAVFPPLPTTPRAVEAGAALSAFTLAALSILVVPRLPSWATAVSVCLTAVLLDVLAATMPTGQGQVLAALGLVMLCVFAAQHLSGRGVAATLVIGLGGYVVALVVDPQIPGAAVYAVAIVLVCLAVTAQVARLESRLRDQALHDPLTGALNRHGLAERAPAVRDLAARARRPTTVVLADVDGFKTFNDEHGHAAGDTALAGLVAAWRPLLRSSDLVGRYGGDEFALVLPGSDPAEVCGLLARLREVSPLPWTPGAEAWAPGEDLFVALARADERLYEGKRAHRGPRRCRDGAANRDDRGPSPMARS